MKICGLLVHKWVGIVCYSFCLLMTCSTGVEEQRLGLYQSLVI